MAKLQLVRSSVDPVVGVRHTGGARGAFQQARTAVRLSWRYMDAFERRSRGPTPRGRRFTEAMSGAWFRCAYLNAEE
jgi:hypothetical protein